VRDGSGVPTQHGHEELDADVRCRLRKKMGDILFSIFKRHLKTSMNIDTKIVKGKEVDFPIGVWQGVAMDSLNYHSCPPCLNLLCPVAGLPLQRTYGRFRDGPASGRAPCDLQPAACALRPSSTSLDTRVSVEYGCGLTDLYTF
jgi:hypothetical protein